MAIKAIAKEQTCIIVKLLRRVRAAKANRKAKAELPCRVNCLLSLHFFSPRNVSHTSAIKMRMAPAKLRLTHAASFQSRAAQKIIARQVTILMMVDSRAAIGSAPNSRRIRRIGETAVSVSKG